MEYELQGRTCLVTGASSGIGAGIVRLLSAQGAKVVARPRRTKIERPRGRDRGRGRRHPTATWSALPPWAGRHSGELRRRLASNHAGLGRGCLGRGLRPQFHRSPQADDGIASGDARRKWGRIVNISGSMEPRGLNAAIAAKGALHLWAKGLSCDIAADGVTLNTIQPGRIDSEQIREKLHPTEESRRSFIERNIPIGYFGDAADVAHLVAFLASPAARYITGAVIPVDGGMHNFAALR
jgi:3-oxoacyl-[acyl-carrier protein] reductase